LASLDFFAARTDHKVLIDFLFGSTDARVFESYSEYGQELREFRSFDELAASYPVGVDEHGHGTAVLLQLWSPSVMVDPEIERIALDARHCQGHTFRYRIEGWGLIQLYLGGVHGHIITASHFGHNSEKRARAWGHADGVDWGALTKLSNRIQYHIRRRLAVARVPGRPVLREAYELALGGYTLKDDARSPSQYELQPES
jgi:hypothetical protein